MAFTRVVGPGIHSLSNIDSHNIHSSGIITATKFDGPFDSLSISGNLSIGGTLTYEDVTNIDSIGIVTARTGVEVTANGLVVNAGVSTLAADLSIADKIVHTGDTNTAIRFPAADVFSVETGGTERGRFESGVFLVGLQGENRNFGDEIAAFKGNRTGAGNPGTISLIKDGSSPTGDIGLIHFGASDDHDGYYASIRASSDGSTGGADLPGRLTFETTADSAASPTERLRIDSSGNVAIGTATAGGTFHVEKNGELNVFFEGNASTLGTRISLKNNDATANAYSEIEGTDAGGQGTSAIRFINNSNANNEGSLQIYTRPSGGSSTERLRIASAGQIGLGGANYGTSGQVILSNGSGSAPTWGDVPASGLTTEALVSSGIVTTLNLTAAQDHKVTASGITTITVSGGTEAESHTVRIINSGITTVGFSTYFLFPSGAAPSLPTADGAISLISFTVNRVGSVGIPTQLLSGASVNFS